jgi:hypothetical protein
MLEHLGILSVGGEEGIKVARVEGVELALDDGAGSVEGGDIRFSFRAG